MQKYIFLANWTDQGVQDTSNSVHRATVAVDTMETLGARIYEVYWTAGPYDLALMAEIPDQETAHAVSLALAKGGNIRAMAMRAFDRGEMLSIVATLDEISGSEED